MWSDASGRSTLVLGRTGSKVWVEVAADASGSALAYRLTFVEPGGLAQAADRPLLEAMTRSGFLLLAEDPGRELVIGTINRFWPAAGGKAPPEIATPQQFRTFDGPGYAKVAANFEVRDQSDGWALLTTETRIYATDPAARGKFALYWRVIYPGSALIRRMWLAAIQKRAEAG